MTYDHSATTLHRADLDREIDSLRTERLLASTPSAGSGLIDRGRRGVGRLLVATGTALIGREGSSLRTHRV